MNALPPPVRVAHPISADGDVLQYAWRLTDNRLMDPVEVRVDVMNVLPIVFVPGIMGTNLMSKDDKQPVWRLDTTAGVELSLAGGKLMQRAGPRQKLLHPDRTEVDSRGNVPTRPGGSITDVKQYKDRGWGEVGQGSYHAFLLKLEETFNGFRSGVAKTAVDAQIAALMAERSGVDSPWRPQKPFIDSVPEDFAKLRNWMLPVYACGYNWLDDNAKAAKRLQQRIEQVIAQHNGRWSRCEQVIVITHSMGGLVARACQALPGMQDKIAGIVHGVMPANGAAVAYRRCKVGMLEEDPIGGRVIGGTGQEVTAVFSQAPGALELLPTQRYDRGWLEVRDADGKTVQKRLHETDPYGEIYSRRDRWWALVKEEWLAPEGGVPITWEQYLRYLEKAQKFHQQLTDKTYHPNTYAFYGADTKGKTKSFERVVWRMKHFPGRLDPKAPSADEVYGMSAQAVEMDGVNPEIVRSGTTGNAGNGLVANRQSPPQWLLQADMQDGSGDGTVPSQSGHAPTQCDGVRQVFRLSGVEHEGAYRGSTTAQQVTVYAISKIALEARVPASATGAKAKA